MIILSLFIFILGLALGSFLNVCIHRLPRGESLLHPSSHCPQCLSPLRWQDNIPLLSYLLLKGRCRNCHSPISPRYPLVEGLTGASFLFLFLLHQPLSLSSFPFFFKDLLFLSLLIPVFFIDLENQLIPDRLSYTALISGFLLSLFTGSFLSSLLGIGMGAGLFLAIVFLGELFLKQEGMGGGDVKLAAAIGAFLGWRLALICFFLSFLLGGIVAAFLLLTHLKGRRERIPFAPFLVGGSFMVIFAGERLLDFYLTLFW